MGDIAGRDPFRELAEIFDTFRRPERQASAAPSYSDWSPACDVREDDNEIVVIAELPGTKLEDINLEVTADSLSIQGERKFEQEENKKWVRVERPYGKFSRSFSISVPINLTDVRASYKDGLLTVTIPKSEDIKPKRISVEAG